MCLPLWLVSNDDAAKLLADSISVGVARIGDCARYSFSPVGNHHIILAEQLIVVSVRHGNEIAFPAASVESRLKPLAGPGLEAHPAYRSRPSPFVATARGAAPYIIAKEFDIENDHRIVHGAKRGRRNIVTGLHKEPVRRHRRGGCARCNVAVVARVSGEYGITAHPSRVRKKVELAGQEDLAVGECAVRDGDDLATSTAILAGGQLARAPHLLAWVERHPPDLCVSNLAIVGGVELVVKQTAAPNWTQPSCFKHQSASDEYRKKDGAWHEARGAVGDSNARGIVQIDVASCRT